MAFPLPKSSYTFLSSQPRLHEQNSYLKPLCAAQQPLNSVNWK